MSSFDLMIPPGALDREHETGVVATTAEPGHEKIVRCTSCGTIILLGGYIDDINPDTYRGVFCCQANHDQWDEA